MKKLLDYIGAFLLAVITSSTYFVPYLFRYEEIREKVYQYISDMEM